MSEPSAQWWLLGLAVAVTYLWRGLGAMFSSRIQPDGPLFQWVSCVSHAMLAGLIARMTVLPLGALAATPLTDRLLGMAVAFVAFHLGRGRILPAVVAGVVTFSALTALR